MHPKLAGWQAAKNRQNRALESWTAHTSRWFDLWCWPHPLSHASYCEVSLILSLQVRPSSSCEAGISMGGWPYHVRRPYPERTLSSYEANLIISGWSHIERLASSCETGPMVWGCSHPLRQASCPLTSQKEFFFIFFIQLNQIKKKN